MYDFHITAISDSRKVFLIVSVNFNYSQISARNLVSKSAFVFLNVFILN